METHHISKINNGGPSWKIASSNNNKSENRSECNGGFHKDLCVYQRKTEGFQGNWDAGEQGSEFISADIVAGKEVCDVIL